VIAANAFNSAFGTDDIAALTTANIGGLGSAQVAAMTSANLRAIETVDLRALKTNAIVGLNSSTFAGLTSEQVGVLSSSQIAALGSSYSLTSTQIGGLRTDQAAKLTSSQVNAMSTAALALMGTNSVAVLATNMIGAISTAAFEAFNSAQIAALTSNQVRVLSSGQMATLSTTELRALDTQDLRVLNTDALKGLSTDHFRAMTTDQVQSLTSTQIVAMTTAQQHAWTTDQINALTGAQLPHLKPTPVILDLNGDGVSTLSVNAGVQFDIFAAGSKTTTGWVGGGDGLLVLDRNGDGQINDGGELFGSSVTLADGSRAKDGYVAMQALDSNGDGVLNGEDSAFGDLKVWIDNGDGVSQSGELRSLSDLGIVSLDLKAVSTSVEQNGNTIGLTSSYTTADGASHEMADVWFTAQADDLRNKVAGLTQALSAFSEAAAAPAPSATPSLLPAGNALSVGLTVSAMADTLKQFSAHGKLLEASGLANTESTKLKALHQDHGTGFLAVPK
jgi:hypothetical protein